MSAKKTLREVLPLQALGGEYTWTEKKLNTLVVERHDGGWNWPGRHKNVCVWWELADGTAVAWNENTSRGWSFPIIRSALRTTRVAEAQ